MSTHPALSLEERRFFEVIFSCPTLYNKSSCILIFYSKRFNLGLGLWHTIRRRKRRDRLRRGRTTSAASDSVVTGNEEERAMNHQRNHENNVRKRKEGMLIVQNEEQNRVKDAMCP